MTASLLFVSVISSTKANRGNPNGIAITLGVEVPEKFGSAWLDLFIEDRKYTGE